MERISSVRRGFVNVVLKREGLRVVRWCWVWYVSKSSTRLYFLAAASLPIINVLNSLAFSLTPLFSAKISLTLSPIFANFACIKIDFCCLSGRLQIPSFYSMKSEYISSLLLAIWAGFPSSSYFCLVMISSRNSPSAFATRSRGRIT